MHEKIKSNKRFKKTILGKANVFTFFLYKKEKTQRGVLNLTELYV